MVLIGGLVVVCGGGGLQKSKIILVKISILILFCHWE